MRTERYLRLVEFALWVLAVAAIAIVGSLVLGLLIDQNLMTGKYVMFVVGFLMFGAGAIAMQPSGPNLEGTPFEENQQTAARNRGLRSMFGNRSGESGVDDGAGDDTSGTGFEERLQQVGPLAEHELPPEARIGRGAKLFVTSLLVLGASFVLEVVGVQV